MSEPERTIQLVASWLDAVDTGTAWSRVEQAQARHRARGIALREPCASTVEIGAVHESAHVVVAHVSAIEVNGVMLRCDGSGAADYTAPGTAVEKMIARTCADLGGAIAELILGVHPWRRQALAQSSDVLLARLNADICRELMPAWSLTNRFFATVAYCAVVSNWPAIERTAHALRAAGALSAGRIRALASDGLQAAR